ncbi:MAG TPA: metallophosphoesterase, partial [Rhodospirillum rubrum]|nr:metallophosphoesterase [Rhodospirillum rubrum]
MLIAQTSDLHIRPPGMLVGGVVDTAAALEACVAHLQALAHRPDLLLITGDLTQQGRPEEYAHLRRLLAPLDLPLLVCPGNHDDRAALRAGLDGLCPWPEPPGAGIPDGATLDLTFDLGPLRLIGLDSLRSGHSGGALSASQEAWLDSALSEAAFLDKPVVLFLHHPPFPMGIDHLDAARLDQSETLGLLLDRHPGRVVRLLCGHAHRHVTTCLL